LKLGHLNFIEKAIYILLGLSLVVGMYFIYVRGLEAFEGVYVMEDGLIEYGTALFLLAIGVLNFRRVIKFRHQHTMWWIISVLFLGLLFIFGAGEEVSWGQRLIGFETPESLKEINKQDEVTLHNIRIGDFDVNKAIFSQLLTVILVIYFVFLPFLFNRIAWIKSLVNALGVPVPKTHHTIVFLIATAIALIIPSEKKWELHEFVFASIFFLIFLYPANEKSIN